MTIFIFNLWFQWSIALEKQFSNELETYQQVSFLSFIPTSSFISLHMAIWYILTLLFFLFLWLPLLEWYAAWNQALLSLFFWKYYFHVPAHSMIHQHFLNEWMNTEMNSSFISNSLFQKYLAQRINYVESTKFQKDSSHFYPISIQNKSCYTY